MASVEQQVAQKAWNTIYPPTVQEVRAEGWKIGVRHLRRMIGFSVDDFDNLVMVCRRPGKTPEGKANHLKWTQHLKSIDSKGGWCIVTLTSPEGKTFEGRARCSKKDMYDYSLAYRIAVGRAVANLLGRVAEPGLNHS